MATWFTPTLDWSGSAAPFAAAVAAPWWSWSIALVLCLVAGGRSFGGSGAEPGVRAPILAGTWYEGSPAALDSSATRYLRGEGRPDVPFPEGSSEARRWAREGRHPVAVIVPHAGHVFSGPCAGLTIGLLRGAEVRRVVLIGPSHRARLSGAAVPVDEAFATPLGRIELDRGALDAMARLPGFAVNEPAHAAEHSLEIELPLLQEALPGGFTLVPLVIGHLSAADVQSIGGAIASLLEDPGTVLVASSDFTHYGPNYDYLPFRDDVPRRLADLDGGAARRILSRDLHGFESYVDSTGATICGAEPIRILLRAIQGRDVTARWIDYYRSGDLLDDFVNTVSYAGIAFFPGPPAGTAPEKSSRTEAESPDPGAAAPEQVDAREQAFLLDLARKAVRAAASRGSLPAASAPGGTSGDSPLREKRGVFVTLTEQGTGRLRGCIGNILGDRPLVEGVVENAVNAALNDPRFPPVTPAEEPRLHIEISVLTPLTRVSGPEAIVVGRDGVMLQKRGRRAVFLPQVAPEQGWDVPTMLRNLSMKAGLGPDEWKEGTEFQVFQAQVFEEEP